MSNNFDAPVKLSEYVLGSGYSRVRAFLREGKIVEGLLKKDPSLKHYPYIFSDEFYAVDRRYDENGRFWDTPNPLDITLLSRVNDPILYMSRGELQLKVSELQAELNKCKKLLDKLDSRKVWELQVGEELEDGSTLLKKSEGMALVVSPEFLGSWDDSFDILKKHGPQWWLPTVKQLNMAAEALPGIFTSGKMFWSCEAANQTYSYTTGRLILSLTQRTDRKDVINFIRGFRCITFDPM